MFNASCRQVRDVLPECRLDQLLAKYRRVGAPSFSQTAPVSKSAAQALIMAARTGAKGASCSCHPGSFASMSSSRQRLRGHGGVIAGVRSGLLMLKRRGRIDDSVMASVSLPSVCESVRLIVSALCSKGRLPSSAILAQLLAPFDCGACLMTDKWV